jgi:hypothetical protein
VGRRGGGGGGRLRSAGGRVHVGLLAMCVVFVISTTPSPPWGWGRLVTRQSLLFFQVFKGIKALSWVWCR